ncbi:hypothetical protein [Tepidimonas charontis]|uniref:Uncharacterized protein n=1 Tax=Tepidimonas charontis TaxID=2267262 RepID=A0A554XF61_9BURK|nr:hypothetical protein [Tepidimonas charontis]TSE34419.1 hypothetical protein Tchar_01394 [Tepidimonas charontis]
MKATVMGLVMLAAAGGAWACAHECGIAAAPDEHERQVRGGVLWRAEEGSAIIADTTRPEMFLELADMLAECRSDAACQGVVILGVKAMRREGGKGGEQ